MVRNAKNIPSRDYTGEIKKGSEILRNFGLYIKQETITRLLKAGTFDFSWNPFAARYIRHRKMGITLPGLQRPAQPFLSKQPVNKYLHILFKQYIH